MTDSKENTIDLHVTQIHVSQCLAVMLQINGSIINMKLSFDNLGNHEVAKYNPTSSLWEDYVNVKKTVTGPLVKLQALRRRVEENEYLRQYEQTWQGFPEETEETAEKPSIP